MPGRLLRENLVSRGIPAPHRCGKLPIAERSAALPALRRTTLQYQGLQQWLSGVDKLVCIEIGAGTNIPTVRHFSENCGGRLIRINPGEPQVPDPHTGIALALGGLAGIQQLRQAFAEA